MRVPTPFWLLTITLDVCVALTPGAPVLINAELIEVLRQAVVTVNSTVLFAVSLQVMVPYLKWLALAHSDMHKNMMRR
jgi:hypothetical protein